jgi:hypothetical protein
MDGFLSKPVKANELLASIAGMFPETRELASHND